MELCFVCKCLFVDIICGGVKYLNVCFGKIRVWSCFYFFYWYSLLRDFVM